MEKEFSALEHAIWDVEFMTADPRRLADYLRAQAVLMDEAADELEEEVAWDALNHDYEVEK